MDFEQRNELTETLRLSVDCLRDLNLYNATKWCSEALTGLRPLTNQEAHSVYLRSKNPQRGNLPEVLPELSQQEEMLLFLERDKITLAQSYFNTKEFARSAHVLKDCKSAKGLFVRLYSTFLNGEKIKGDQGEGILTGKDGVAPNPKVSEISGELEAYCSADRLTDPFLLYLYGVIQMKQGDISQARESLYRSLVHFPYNWSCWEQLGSTFKTFDEALTMIERFEKNHRFSSSRNYGTMLLFFKVFINQSFFQQSEDVYQDIEFLLEIFPNFSFLKIQKALISYNSMDYPTAEHAFDDVLVNDPFRLDDLDAFSNILYVMEKKSKLAFLAQFASAIDKFRPETCCIVANYYSLKFQHEKAIMYYKRALSLNKNCLSAWTLMGHEFVELKNSHAAIESYRRAVDTNNKDFRAWYGLGQAYEVLDMHLYSLYYYQRACALKPQDQRMWQALANCYERLGGAEESIKAYKKALAISEADSNILYKIAMLYESLNDVKNSVVYMKLTLAEEVNEGVSDETAKARLWLAKFEAANNNWPMVYRYASEMNEGSAHDIEEARTLAREARVKMKSS
ncbi:unnamed protein product [Kuraishia capsulata CBS 1993]|uniref:Cdc23 domain-containing protein n=1 Tax=Kuraishia capsulata CBS 1993 TaxID=1382522 RepID=W6MT37_9ASCO|nr:uncharacterized protein KUCA_T00004359001 [Kuraishia capsulata CBS 1993]CDK28377.1 unnamed protein product [Kuraishia capsulata CBS 1993]